MILLLIFVCIERRAVIVQLSVLHLCVCREMNAMVILPLCVYMQ